MSSTTDAPAIIEAASHFHEPERAAIARHVGVTVEHPAFEHYLGMAAYLGLSPLLDEIFLVQTDTFNRDTGIWDTTLRPAVGRDGFLKHARRDANFYGAPRGNVVCANDHFEFSDDGREVTILHKVDGDETERGEVKGAWAKLFFRDGQAPFFFYAPLSEYGKRGVVAGTDGAEGEEDWVGAWSYTSAMILKCAQSYVLRIGFGISGVVPADEIRGGVSTLVADTSGSGKVRKHPQASNNESIVRELIAVDDATKDRLVAALARVNDLSPFSWATAKVSVSLEGVDQAAAEKVLAQIEREVAKLQEPRA